MSIVNDTLIREILLKDTLTGVANQLTADLDLNGFNIDFPTTANISDCLDEDNMASDSATKLATQQSIKAYVDNNLTGIVCNDNQVICNNNEIVIT